MSVLLTLSQPSHTELGVRGAHDFSRVTPPSSKLDRPAVTQLRASIMTATHNDRMSTQHRGLPPPSAMNLPDPSRQPPPAPAPPPTLIGQQLGAMPAPPGQWPGQEDSMRNWLAAKAEEDKRKQEEEKTRQETLKLEQRRIEQTILRESLQGGIPPQMVPIIYAGIGGSAGASGNNLAQISLDWLHQYASQLQTAQQQQLQHPSPRMIAQSSYQPAPTSHQSLPNPHALETGQPATSTQPSISAYPTPSRSVPSGMPRSLAHSQLPRLTTNDMFVHQSPTNPSSAHPLQQSQTLAQDAPASSPSIYFHHWVPPSESGKNPQTPASKGRRDEEPLSAHPGSHVSESDYKESPRKRKAQGGHQPNPPPSSAPHFSGGSPNFSAPSNGSGKRSVPSQQRKHSVTSLKDEIRSESRREEMSRMSFHTEPTRADEAEEDRYQHDRPVSRADSRRGEEYPRSPGEIRKAQPPNRAPPRQEVR